MISCSHFDSNIFSKNRNVSIDCSRMNSDIFFGIINVSELFSAPRKSILAQRPMSGKIAIRSKTEAALAECGSYKVFVDNRSSPVRRYQTKKKILWMNSNQDKEPSGVVGSFLVLLAKSRLLSQSNCRVRTLT